MLLRLSMLWSWNLPPIFSMLELERAWMLDAFLMIRSPSMDSGPLMSMAPVRSSEFSKITSPLTVSQSILASPTDFILTSLSHVLAVFVIRVRAAQINLKSGWRDEPDATLAPIAARARRNLGAGIVTCFDMSSRISVCNSGLMSKRSVCG